MKASYGIADAKSSDTAVHAEVSGYNGNAKAEHTKDGHNTARAETKGIPNDGEKPKASADASPGVNEGELWKAKFYQQQEESKKKEKDNKEKADKLEA